MERAFTAFLVMVYNTFGDANFQATGIRCADVVSGIGLKAQSNTLRQCMKREKECGSLKERA